MQQLNRNLQKLIAVGQKHERLGIGLMSGTSLDGLDIALCHFTGNGMNTQTKLLAFESISYHESFRTEIRQVFSKRMVDLEKLCLLNANIGHYFADLINNQLKVWKLKPTEIDFIASHGQTIYHAPQRLHKQTNYPNATLQIGDADHIAVKTGIITISDFRQKNIAAGGEGAPLALYGDVILASKPTENRILLNIGGIANFTWLPGNYATQDIICSDTGPGNTLIDAACKTYFNIPYDKDALIALSGSVNYLLLDVLSSHPFFAEALPKTTGPELFNITFLDDAIKQTGLEQLKPADIVATLTAFTAKTIANAIAKYTSNANLLISGGGAHNPFLLQCLKTYLPDIFIADTRYAGIPPDAKEAILFGILGNEAIGGEPLQIGGYPSVLMGKFSFPI